MSLTMFFRLWNRTSGWRPPRSRLQVERLEDRCVPSVNIDISHTSTPEVEANIDLNPVNPQNLVATAIHGSLSQHPPPPPASAFFSRDSGETWSPSSPLPLSIGGVTYRFSGDATVAFDGSGDVYVSYIAANFTPRGIPIAIAIAKSTDGGQTFTQVTAPAAILSDGSVILDHPKVAVDRNPSSPFRDTVYATWVNESAALGSRLVLSRSTDGGVTWSAPLTFENDGNDVNLNTQTIGPDGAIDVSWVRDDPAGQSTQFLARSTDGGATFGGHVAVTTLHALPQFGGEAFSSPAQPNRTGVSAITAQASIDVDRSAGPFRGRLYMAYADRPDPDARPFDEDVYLKFSDDHGQTWSPQIRVNDDGAGSSQFFPSLSVDPTTGKVLISWYDTRRDPVTLQKTDVFLAVGNPSRHGVHFRKNLRVTDQQSDESANNSQAIGWYGDYEGLVAYGGVAHPVWIDARASNVAAGLREEVYTAAIPYGDREDDDGSALLATLRPEPAPFVPPTTGPASEAARLLLPSAPDVTDHRWSRLVPRGGGDTLASPHARRASLASLPDEWDDLQSASDEPLPVR
jgi:hypothetical protein